MQEIGGTQNLLLIEGILSQQRIVQTGMVILSLLQKICYKKKSIFFGNNNISTKYLVLSRNVGKNSRI